MLSLILALQAATTSPAAFNPNANALFDRDEILHAWAVEHYDRNGDGWLTLYEAQPALQEFKAIADSDGDDRITTAEYRRAREYIVARYGG